jgi:hypothetical protein
MRKGLKGPAHRFAWLLPHINVEDLNGPGMLISLLNARAMHHPHIFAWSDAATNLTAVFENAVDFTPIPSFTLLFMGRKTRSSYGQVVSCKWAEIMKNMDPKHEGTWFHPDEGFLLLEA